MDPIAFGSRMTEHLVILEGAKRPIESQKAFDRTLKSIRKQNMRFGNYDTEGFYDELCLPDGTPRPAAEPLFTKINELPEGEL